MILENAALLHSQATSLLQQGEFVAAEQTYRQLLLDAPGDPRARFGLAKALVALNRQSEAEDYYLAAIALDPGYFEALANLGSLYLSQAKRGDAMAYYLRAEQAKPGNPEILSNLCYLNKELGNFPDALAYGRRALESNGQHVGAMINLAATLNEMERYAEALPYLRHADAMSPGHPLVLHNLGVTLEALRDYEMAKSCYLAALEKNPQSVPTLFGLSVVNKLLRQHDEAEANLKAALALAPDELTLKESLGFLQLRLGRFREGWINHVSRSQSSQDRSAPPALPAHLAEARILLLGEQGVGDELFFLRFASGLKLRGAQLTYRGSARLRPLLADQNLFGEWLGTGSDVSAVAFDAVVSVGNLPLVVGMGTDADIPPPVELRVAPDVLTQVAERMSRLAEKPCIGVTWRAGTENVKGLLHKEIPLSLVGGALKDLPASIIVLQRNPKPGEIDRLSEYVGREVFDFSDANANLEEMLALLSLLQEYVGVSNTNMHLMAGLGKTARVVIPYPAEWRWMDEGEQSPWFAGFQLYRQGMMGEWDAVMSALSRDLNASLKRG